MLPTGVWHAQCVDALGRVCPGSWNGGRHMHRCGLGRRPGARPGAAL